MNEQRERFHIIARDLPKVEAEIKARGECQYPSDVVLPNMLHCKVLRNLSFRHCSGFGSFRC